MRITLPLDQMTKGEKLELMEALWKDLSNQPDALQSPDWHAEVLEQRRAEAASGDDAFTDWEAAKEEIRRRTS
jgi:hypothetical protein